MDAIKTFKVKNRRTLRFDSLGDIAAEVERLAKAREIKALGNWSPGQVFQHLSIVMNGAIDGIHVKLPLAMRIIVPAVVLILKSRILNKPMPAGFRLNADAAKVLVPPPTSVEDGLAAIRNGLHRLANETKREVHPFMGKLNNEEWDKLQCRHCEMHLSFLVPVE